MVDLFCLGDFSLNCFVCYLGICFNALLVCGFRLIGCCGL